jgi:hypothetical protein
LVRTGNTRKLSVKNARLIVTHVTNEKVVRASGRNFQRMSSIFKDRIIKDHNFMKKIDILRLEFEEYFSVEAIKVGHPISCTGGRHPAFHRFFNNSGKNKSSTQLLEAELLKHGVPSWP